jgi:hypothetical protein
MHELPGHTVASDRTRVNRDIVTGGEIWLGFGWPPLCATATGALTFVIVEKRLDDGFGWLDLNLSSVSVSVCLPSEHA